MEAILAINIIYKCAPPQGIQLRCSFRKLEIKKERPATPAEIEAQIAARGEAVAKGQGLNKEQCASIAAVANGVRTGKVPEGMDKDTFARKFTSKEEAEKRDMLEDFDGLLKVCGNPTRESHENSVRVEEAQKARTCRLFTLDFDETFTRGSTSNVWTSTSTPAGPCGTITIGVLERDAKRTMASFWRYKVRRLVTNKTGAIEMFGGKPPLLCKDLDEQEYIYEWAGDVTYRGCVYIKYGP